MESGGSNTPTIRRLTSLRRHQLLPIALSGQASTEQAQMQQQANQFAQQQLGGLGQSIGGLATMGKG
jgi:hypothetical protein